MKQFSLCVLLVLLAVIEKTSGDETGEATFYNIEGAPTACGANHQGSELVAALNAAEFDPETHGNPNNNKLCNRQVEVKGPAGTATVKIVDRCPPKSAPGVGCVKGDLDLTPAAFKLVGGDQSVGRVKITWKYV
ncbi:unnamed protein product [Didymodactylos carnosus]|uniref:Uncharacterized protein n=1 Tax=Didymodactylos carnosus TaxID=1234261 RepID=A0A813T7M0_9BILA|nr:unnamed protein product [Didymodactylos carnosus]CAF0994547.1 unnamed protein product [Didymodactylos carnosus]CAF3589813.1 unnamed protein product [Didymodactylos carnosus]CAF3764347.1 unnamed protein product [Didymodactylos carnosus]